MMTRAQHLLLYDGECPLCLFQMKLLTWFDWFDQAELKPLQEASEEAEAAGISREDLLTEIHCLSRDGRIHRGAYALRFLGMRMPILMPAAVVMWCPGVMWLADKVYLAVSRNRLVLSRMFGCKEACALMPERKKVG